jgi:phage shock protein PspC (stress-responsive transcriptional regulator)
MVSTGSPSHDVNMSETMSPPTSSPPPPPATRVLYRSRDERMLAGVAGGIAERYGWDPALVRIVFVLVGLMSAGSGIVAYIIAWLVIPEGPEGVSFAQSHFAQSHRRRGQLWLGAVLLGLGLISVLDVLDLDFGPGRVLWPLTLIAAGVALLVVRRARDDSITSPGTPSPPARGASWTPEPEPGGAPFVDTEPLATVVDTGLADTRPGATAVTSAYQAHHPWPGSPPARPPHRWRDPSREPNPLTGIVWGVLLVYAGGVWLSEATDAVEVDLVAALAGAIGIVGLGLIVSAWFGRARGLIALGLVLVVSCTAIALVDVPFRGGIGDRRYEPRSLTEVEPRYQLAVGQLTLDLSALDVPTGERLDIEVTAAIGEVIVEVPADATIEIRGRVDAGELSLLEHRSRDGINVEQTVTAPSDSGGTIDLDVHVGFGAVSVRTIERDAAGAGR